MIDYFKDKIQITVFFAGNQKEHDKTLLSDLFPEIDFVFASNDESITFKDCKEKFAYFIKDKFFDFALIEYIELSIVLEYLPDTTVTILDTHDIVHRRIENFNKFNAEYDGIILTKEEELNIYRCYDYIILIQKRDFENIAIEIGSDNLLLIPHPAHLEKKRVRKEVKNVGYIASPYTPNIDALNWFINNAWDSINKRYGLTLNVYGNIHPNLLAAFPIKNSCIIFHGYVDDIENVYDHIDIIINPVRFGAGLKIKNVEALGYGIPLITTTHGASGIEDGISTAFLRADSAEEYIYAFDRLINNYDLRKQFSDNAFKYARSNFSIQKCYSGLLQIINGV
jgi:glycosyltransferase involved in cell wall biosynthesis